MSRGARGRSCPWDGAGATFSTDRSPSDPGHRAGHQDPYRCQFFARPDEIFRAGSWIQCTVQVSDTGQTTFGWRALAADNWMMLFEQSPRVTAHAAATTAISSSQDGWARAGTVTSVLATRRPPRNSSRAAMACASPGVTSVATR